MLYKFRCDKCNTLVYRDIKVTNYDKEKDEQYCNNCGNKLERIIEWEGPANNLGGYSDIGGRASWQ